MQEEGTSLAPSASGVGKSSAALELMGAATLGASSLTSSLTSSHAHTRAKPGRKQTPAVPLCSYCDRALPQEGSWMNSKRNLPRCPGAEEATRLRAACSTVWLLHDPPRARGACAAPPGSAPARDRARRGSGILAAVPPARSGRFCVRVCLCLRTSACICVYVRVYACVRVAPCVWRCFWACTGVCSHRALS